MVELNVPFTHNMRNGARVVMVMKQTEGHGCKDCAVHGTAECTNMPMACTSHTERYYVSAEAPSLEVLSDPPASGIPYADQPLTTAADYKPSHGGYPATTMPTTSAGHDGRSGHGTQPSVTSGGVRVNDPDTSKGAAARVGGGKLMDLILQRLQAAGPSVAGHTGKELAEVLARPLNSITPRFAQLRRMGLIHAAGRRDKQIVWKIGNGVA